MSETCTCWIGRGALGGWAPDRQACAVHGDAAIAAALPLVASAAPADDLVDGWHPCYVLDEAAKRLSEGGDVDVSRRLRILSDRTSALKIKEQS